MVDKPYSSSVWDEDLSGPSSSSPAALPPMPSQAPAVPYSPGVFDQDLTTPVAPPAPVTPPDTRPLGVRVLQTVDDAVRAAANTVTFGGADRLAGYINSGGPQTLSGLVTGQKPLTYDEAVNAEAAKSAAARVRSPYASVTGDVLGSVALPGFGAEAMAARIGRGFLGRVGAYGATGAGVGALQGAGNTYTGNARDYAENALMGGVLGGVLGGTVGGAFGPRPRISAAQTTTTPEIKAATDFAYDALRKNQAIYEDPHVAALADRLEQQLGATGANRRLNPTSWDVLDDLRAPSTLPGGGKTPAQLEAMRARINEISAHPDSGFDRKTGAIIKNAIDDFYKSPPTGAVRAGTEAHAAAAGDIATTARKLAQGGYHAQTIDNILRNAELAANKPGGGGNYPDLVWQGVKGLETAPKVGARSKLAGYSDVENAALEKVAYPSWLQRNLRSGSEILGGGSHGIVNPFTLAAGGAGTGYGLGSYLGADPTTTAMMGAAAPLGGLAARIASNRMANRAIREASDILHQSNPLYDYRVMTAGTKSGGGLPASVNDATRNAITSAIVNQNVPTRVPIDTTDWQ